MDESKLQPISVLCICSVYYCGEDTEETGERHQVIMLGQHTGHWPRPPDTCIRWPVVTREGWAGGHQLWPHQCQCHLRPDTLSVPGLGWGMTPGQGGTFSLHFFFCHVSNISPFQRYKVNLQSLVFPKHCKHSHKILYFHSTTLIIWAFILQISSFHS